MGSIYCWLVTPGHGICSGGSLRCPVLLHWRKLTFPFPAENIKLKIASWLGIRLCILFAFSLLRFCLVWTCLGLMHIVTVTVSSYVCLLCFHLVNHHLWLLQSLPCPFLHVSLNPEEGCLIEASHLKPKALASHSLNIVYLWALW